MEFIFLSIIAYLLGAIPNGVWIGKLFFQTDIRYAGSKNIGTTNTFRVLGKKAGMVVFVLDVLKGSIATLLPTLFHLNISPLYFGILAILGHSCSIFIKFKGGKSVATSAGMLLAYQPVLCLILALLFALCLYLSSIVSFSSIISSIAAICLVTIANSVDLPFLNQIDLPFILIVFGLAGFIIYRHQDNIKRLKSGEENTVPFGLNLLKQKTFKKR
ncbi:MAG: glycerol-3-phosphate 1-O-acyltransferase PlsY [Streptococcaceae bacterium]|jgi:glycerol-3-phosphate acyltransferase PlsY|nr:glycerol-3-phosphate 1-O-acyltransferase PlsY [Streptococcaceae bacterium]